MNLKLIQSSNPLIKKFCFLSDHHKSTSVVTPSQVQQQEQQLVSLSNYDDELAEHNESNENVVHVHLVTDQQGKCFF